MKRFEFKVFFGADWDVVTLDRQSAMSAWGDLGSYARIAEVTQVLLLRVSLI